jgi:hypothetical protein
MMDSGTWSRRDHHLEDCSDADNDTFADEDDECSDCSGDKEVVQNGVHYNDGSNGKVETKVQKGGKKTKKYVKGKKKKSSKEKKKKSTMDPEEDPAVDDADYVHDEKTKKKKKAKASDQGKDSGKKKKKKKDLSSKERKATTNDKEKQEAKKCLEKTVEVETTPHPLDEIPIETFKNQQEQVKYIEDHVNDEENDSETERMKNMLAQWDDESSDSSSDDDDDDDTLNQEEELISLEKEYTKEELGLNDNEIDHIILAAPDYDEAVKEFETMTGIKPARTGSLKGLGIRTARVATNSNCYIEILAPDPVKTGPIGGRLAKLEAGSLIPYHFAIRQNDLAELQQDYVPNELGYVPDQINLYSTTPDGLPSRWGMLFCCSHFLGGVVPYFVDHGACTHPLSGLPTVGPLKELKCTAPGGSPVHKLLKNIEYTVTEEGNPAIEFSIGTPAGVITFSSDRPEGLVFPGKLMK